MHVQKHQKREKTESVRRALPRLESFVCTVLGNIARKAVWISVAIGKKRHTVKCLQLTNSSQKRLLEEKSGLSEF